MIQYRAFIKSRTDLDGEPLSNAGMKVTSFNVSRDLLTSATSTISLLQTPQSISDGDIIGIYGEDGKVIYSGVVTTNGESIQCSQMASLFNDEYLNIPFQTTNVIENDVKALLTNSTVGSADPLLQDEFKRINFTASTQTKGILKQNTPFETTNLEEFIYNLYDIYDVIVDFELPFNEEKPTLKIYKDNSVKIKLSNNAISILSISPTLTATQTNKLVIYSNEVEETEETPHEDPKHRATYYLTQNGITQDANDLSRVKKISTKYVFSDDEDLQPIVDANLSDELYSHEITVSMALDSKLYDFFSFNLGQKFDIYTSKYVYSTVLTGYTLNYQDYSMPTVILKFGKVRYRLESRLFKLIKNKTVQ